MYVFDATPLVALAKSERLSLLEALERECCTPELVFEEVVTTGIEEGYADARRIERAVETDELSVLPVSETAAFGRLKQNDKLSEADAAVLATAVEMDGTAVMDEQYGRSVADAEGIETRGTAYVVLWLLKTGKLDAEEARETIDAMVDAGWYCSTDLYARILRRIEEYAGESTTPP